MMTLDILRALAGIAANAEIKTEVKEAANKAMLKAIQSLEKQIEVEANMVKKASAEMNGIIS